MKPCTYETYQDHTEGSRYVPHLPVPRTPDETLLALPLEEPSQELSPPTYIVVQDRQPCGMQE